MNWPTRPLGELTVGPRCRRLRNLVRITLRRHKYPPELQVEAIRLVLEQAERLADDWSNT